MKTSVFLKIYAPTLAILWAVTVLCAFSAWLLISEMRHWRSAQHRWAAVQAEQQKLHALEQFAASLKTYEPIIHRLSAPREAVVNEKILVEPFEPFVEKISKIYTDHGFFFLESFVLETCEKNPSDVESQDGCRPYAEVRGKKVYFRP